MKIKALLILVFILFDWLVYAQLDHIEYNIGKQIYDFGITDSQYYFRTWDKKTVIEKDSFVFDINQVFANNPLNYQPDYADTIGLILSSRTLKTFYNEKILYNTPNDYIRICCLKYKYPAVVKFEELGNENIKISFKIGNGCYDRHGDVIYDTTFFASKRYSKKIQNAINIKQFNDFKNRMDCSTAMWTPRIFFFEFKIGENNNTIVISESNLISSNSKDVMKLYKIARMISRKKKLLPKEQML